MPLVRISLLKGKPASYRRKVGEAVHQALVETINVPARDRFQIITEHDPEDFVYDREYLGIQRSRDLVIRRKTGPSAMAWPPMPPRKRHWHD